LDALVDPAWLQDRIGDPDLFVCDTTMPLPGEDFDPKAAFEAAHIPGAHVLDLDLLSDPDTTLPHMVPSPGRFARVASEIGIGNDTTVVFYESRRLFAAPRAWFLFRLFGLERVHVLDGGLAAWRDAGGAIESGKTARRPTADFRPHPRFGLLAGLGDIERLAAGSAVLLDARSSARFEAAAPEPRPGVRSGHIPGSRNLPYGALLDDAGRFRPPDALRALFAAQGVTDATPVVTSCGTGITAAVLTLGLHVAGITETRLFDGSWTEYALAHPEPA
jgi:thiosulfate/3-mercaptopyruvate sulfurtransferase